MFFPFFEFFVQHGGVLKSSFVFVMECLSSHLQMASWFQRWVCSLGPSNCVLSRRGNGAKERSVIRNGAWVGPEPKALMLMQKLFLYGSVWMMMS